MTRKSNSSLLLALGCLFAGSAIAAGAFGAHALKGVLDAQMLTVFDTATRYQMGGSSWSGFSSSPVVSMACL